MSTTTLLAIPLLIVLAVACGGDDGATQRSSDPAAPADSVAGVLEPGDGENLWRVGGGDVGTIEAAWQVGSATRPSPYVEATVSRSTGKAFFVFRAALDEIQLVLQAPPGQPFVESVRLFAVTDAQRGAEVTPSWSVPHGGTWTVAPGEVYLVEVTGPKGAFF